VPEAPQMEALGERIFAAVGGKALVAVHPLQFAALKTFDPDPMSVRGRRLESVGRRGKYSILDFGDGLRIAFHLSQGGRVDIEEPPKATKGKQNVVRFTFEDDVAILIKEFGTERKAGWWVLGPGDDGPMDRLGPEFDSDEFADFIRTSDDGRRVHTILRDQRTVAGIGRGYTDDSLHAAGISPYASLKSLKADERERLLGAIKDILADGLERERRRTGGLPNKLGDGWVVHKAWGQPCPACEDTLQRVSYESYEVTYCPRCQTGGKVLADRRMSRLLK
jgi:formamidopyrimidine-DNA glycosylase